MYSSLNMPSIIAGVTEETEQFIEHLVSRGVYEDKSEAASALIEYAIFNKYDEDTS